jgi:outer membrane protein assembly factor BamE (lipoprotein component of BamABCDE complex)
MKELYLVKPDVLVTIGTPLRSRMFEKNGWYRLLFRFSSKYPGKSGLGLAGKPATK